MDEGNLKPGETISPRKMENDSASQKPAATTPQKPAENAVASTQAAVPIIAPDPVAPPVNTAEMAEAAPAQKEPVVAEAQTEQADIEAEANKFTDDYPEGYEEPEAISWTASEYVAHEKSAGWYVMLVLVGIILAVFVYFVTRDKVSVAVVIFGAIFMSIYASRKPRQLDYILDGRGITIGQKRYDFEEFKSYGIIPEGAFSSIVFMPHKRFAVPINIYYPPEQEKQITNAVGLQLPLEDHKHDAVDRLLKSIRF